MSVWAKIGYEHCDVTESYPPPAVWDEWDGNSSAGPYLRVQGHETETYRRTAQTVWHLHTGGKALPRQNLWQLSGSAREMLYKRAQPPFPYYTPTSVIPAQDIQVMGESLDTNGNLYAILPDGADLDVTPQVGGVDFYTFNVGAQKYLSHFEVFVCQPDPNGTWVPDPDDPSGMTGSLVYLPYVPGIHAGHAWWKLWTDAPTDAVNKMTLNSVNLEYLGVEVGYGPTNGTSLWNPSTKALITAPGEFPWPNTDTATTNATYTIGFWDLIHGLNYAESIKASPGTYSVANPENDCVSKTRGYGSSVGVTLPNDRSPEFFGFHLPPDNQ